jgi:DmsE family decaheme c-type cytochrome
MLLLGVGILCIPMSAAPAPGEKPAAAPAKQAAPADFVGAETCASCHEAEASKFATNPHAKMAQLHGNNGVTCENCHGAGRLHTESGGDATLIFNPAKAAPKDVDAKCLRCHSGKHQNFDRSAHAENNLSCVTCHTVHAATTPEHLLKAPQPTLCFQCHTDIKSQFAMPFHHKVNEGLLVCTDCHNPHGTYGKKNLLSAATQDQVCVKCHVEKAGPFVYEHAPSKTEGCISCHTPHGGPTARLLNRPSVNLLCIQCHSPSPNFSTESPGHNQNGANYNTCTICHTAIHGSNINKRFATTY